MFNVECWRDLDMWLMGRSKSLKMAPVDRSYDLPLVSETPNVTIALSRAIFDLFDVE